MTIPAAISCIRTKLRQLETGVTLIENELVSGTLASRVIIHNADKHIWTGQIGTSEWNAAINLDTDYIATGEHHLGDPALPAVWLAAASATVSGQPYACFAVQIAAPSGVSGDVWNAQGDPYALHVTTHGTDGGAGVAGRAHFWRNWSGGTGEIWIQGRNVTPAHCFVERGSAQNFTANTSFQALAGFTSYSDALGIYVSAAGVTRFAIPAGENWKIELMGTLSQSAAAGGVQVLIYPITGGVDGTPAEMGVLTAGTAMPLNLSRVVTGAANRVYEVRVAFLSTPTSPSLRAGAQILASRVI